MSKLFKTVFGGTVAIAFAVGGAVGAAAQEAPVPVPEESPVPVEAPAPVPAEAPAPAVEEAPVAEAAVEGPDSPIVVELNAVGGAEGSGEATLSDASGDQTEAVVEVEGLEPGSEWSAFLVAGTCDSPGDLVSPLGTIEVADEGSGRGEVGLTTSLTDLTDGEATVQVHPAGDTPTQAVLCGAVAADGPELPAF